MTWLQAASPRRIAVAAIAGAIAGIAISGVALNGLLSPALGETFYWWLLAWGGLAVLAAVGVQVRIEIARPIAGILVGTAALLALGADMLSGFALDPLDVVFTVLLAIVSLFGIVSFIALGLTKYAIGIALEGIFRR